MPAMPPHADRAVRSTWSESVVVAQMAGSRSARPGRHDAQAPDLGGERRELVVVGQVAVEEQVPGLLEADALGQLDGGVLPVVEEALVAADVAELGVGDDDLGEALRDA